MALRKPEKLGVSNAAEPLEATAARRYTPPKFSDRLPYALAASATVLTSFLWFELPFKLNSNGFKVVTHCCPNVLFRMTLIILFAPRGLVAGLMPARLVLRPTMV